MTRKPNGADGPLQRMIREPGRGRVPGNGRWEMVLSVAHVGGSGTRPSTWKKTDDFETGKRKAGNRM